MKNLNKLFMFIFVICLFGMFNFSTVKAEDEMSATLMEKKTTVSITTDPDAADTEMSDSKFVGDDVCDESSVKQVIRMFGWMIYVAKLFVPLIVIGRGFMLFYKAVVSDSDKDLKVSAIEFGKKILVGILIFFVPTLIDALYDAFADFNTVADEYSTCEECLLSPSKCE